MEDSKTIGVESLPPEGLKNLEGGLNIIVPNLDKTEEIQKAFSEVAAEFAAETGKAAEENPEELKAHNLPEDQQMEFNSKFFKMYNTHFAGLITKLPKKSAARVIKRLIAYPLETSDLTWVSKEEKDAFLIGNQLLEVKYLMYKYVMSEQIAKETIEKIKNDTNKGEAANGENKES